MRTLERAPSFHDLLALPSRLVEKGGPSRSERGLFVDWLDMVDGLVAAGTVPRQTMVDFWRALGPEYLAGCAQGHALAKPYGYAGDFQMMDMVYRFQLSSDPRFRAWDLFFHEQAAAQAVRNRPSYFAAVMDRAIARLRRPLRVLDVGCGPAHHLVSWLGAHPSADVQVVCVDHDPRALARAREVCAGAGGRVRFEQANVLRYDPPQSYDVIWSSGLFDYLSDRFFVRLAARFRAALRPGGELTLGNFGPDNPGRAYMELVGDWHLRYRSEGELLRIADLAGAAPGEAWVGRDDTGVNLFLHVRMAGHG